MYEPLVEEHRQAVALAERLSASEPGAARDAVLAELDRLLSRHLAAEQQYLASALGQRFKAPSEFKAATEFKAAPEAATGGVVSDALPPALAALVHGGPDTDVTAATSALVQALNAHVHHTEQDLFPLVAGAEVPGGEEGEQDLPPADVARDVTPDEVAELEAEHERGT